jgi:serine/threonine protein kinase
MLGSLKHPNIVEFVGFNFEQGFLILEYVDFGDLFSSITKPETRLEVHGWGLILGIAEGLAFLHSKCILHLDLKSLNVLVRTSPFSHFILPHWSSLLVFLSFLFSFSSLLFSPLLSFHLSFFLPSRPFALLSVDQSLATKDYRRGAGKKDST